MKTKVFLRKAPSTKLQAPEKLQAPSSKQRSAYVLKFGIWSFSGAWCLVLGALLLVAPNSWALPKIKILATGGTIAGAQASTSDAGYKSGAFSVENLISAVPGLKDIAEVTGEQIANIGSQTMNDAVWLKLAKRINELLAKPDVDGIVITHGTDTMEETGYFLHLVVNSVKPVVLVGSMRPATAISADGPLNLYNAVGVAADPDAKGRGILVVINDQIFCARNVTKTHTTDIETFQPLNRGAAGEAYVGKNRWFEKPALKYTVNSEFRVDKVDAMPKVDILYSYANATRDLVDAAVAAGAKGIVLAGVGDGNSTDSVIAGLSDAAKKGVLVVRSSRVGSGIVRRNVEVNDDKNGFIAAEELNPSKARVLLMLGLMKTNDVKKLQQYFYEY
jgi:L-asparaginase